MLEDFLNTFRLLSHVLTFLLSAFKCFWKGLKYRKDDFNFYNSDSLQQTK